MRLFVTGMAGFIGMHAARRLAQLGHAVAGCDSYNNYYEPALKRARAAELAQLDLVVQPFNLCDGAALKEALDRFQPTHILHLAAQAGVRYAREAPLSYIESNITGWVQLLEACKERNVRIVYASSSSVYGLTQQVPFSEEDAALKPANLYAATKRSKELIGFSYHHLYQMPMVGLRFFTVYGPWGRPDMAYYKFTKALLEERPLTIFGDGSMQRDFTYIDDIVDGIVTALQLNASWEILNLGGSHPYSVLELLGALEKLTGKRAIVRSEPASSDEVKTTWADLTKSHQLLGYRPKISLEEGLGSFVDWYQKQRIIETISDAGSSRDQICQPRHW